MTLNAFWTGYSLRLRDSIRNTHAIYKIALVAVQKVQSFDLCWIY